MAVLLDQSATFSVSGEKTREGTQPPSHWFLISDTGWNSLRIHPGLHVGETTEGEFVVGGVDSAQRWLSFRADDDGIWFAVASDGVRLCNEEKEFLERQLLLPGLVLVFPNNRLLVSEDSLVCPAPGLVISVRPQSSGHVEQDLLMPEQPPVTGASDSDPVARSIQDAPKSRSWSAFAMILLSALALMALPAIIDELELSSTPMPVVEPNPVIDAQPAHELESEAVTTEVATVSLEAEEPAGSKTGNSATDSSSSALVDLVTDSFPVDPVTASAAEDSEAEEVPAVVASTVIERVSIEASALFGFDSAVLSDDAKAVIDTHIKALTGGESASSITRVEGHTDSTGPEEYNLYLSRLRANAVADYIESRVDAGTDSDIEALGKGESEPLVSNETREGRAANRRVDIIAQRQITR